MGMMVVVRTEVNGTFGICIYYMVKNPHWIRPRRASLEMLLSWSGGRKGSYLG